MEVSPTLHVLTPVIRTENLRILRDELDEARARCPLKWWVAPDAGYLATQGQGAALVPFPLEGWIEWMPVELSPRPVPCCGEHVLNPVLDRLSAEQPDTDYFWFHADDTAQIPAFYDAVAEGMREGLRAMVFPLEYHPDFPNGIPARPLQMVPGGVDAAQCVFSLGLLGAARYPEGSTPDGHLAELLWNGAPFMGWRFFRAPRARYNALRPAEPRPRISR